MPRDWIDDVVDDLFMNGVADQADRLVLTSTEGRDLGGLCREAMAMRIREAYRKHQQSQRAALSA